MASMSEKDIWVFHRWDRGRRLFLGPLNMSGRQMGKSLTTGYGNHGDDSLQGPHFPILPDSGLSVLPE